MPSPAKKGIFNIFWGIIGQLITICLGFVVPRLVLKCYGSEVNGLINSVNQIFVCFGLFEAGVGVASLQALYAPVSAGDRDQISAIMSATHRFYLKTGIVYSVAVVCLAFLYPLAVHVEMDYFLVAGIILFGGLGNCFHFIYQGKYKILMQAEGYLYVSTNITTVINILTNLVRTLLLVLGFDVIYVQMSFFLIDVVQLLIYRGYVRRHYTWVDLHREPDRQAIGQKNAVVLHQLSRMVFNNTDTILLTFITQNLKIVSIYTMYNMVSSMVTSLIQQVSTGFDFKLGQMYGTDREQYFRLHHIFEIIEIIVIFSAMTVFYIFILPFMRLYTADVKDIDYIDRMYPVLFALVPMLTYGRVAASNVISYAGHFKQTQWRAVAEAVINITVSVFCIWRFGLYGALFGTLAAAMYRTNDTILYAYKHLLHDNPLKTYKRLGLSFLVFGLAVCFVDIDNRMLRSYGQIILYGTGYGICILGTNILVQAAANWGECRYFAEIIRAYAEPFCRNIIRR